MDLQELLGADYREGMTADDVSAVFEKRFLNTGKYTNKEKADADLRASKKASEDLQNQLRSKMSDDELTKTEIEDLKKALKEKDELAETYMKMLSKNSAEAGVAEAKTILGIKEDDKEFAEFLDNISLSDSEKTKKTSSYVMKMVKEAYEKGKAEATKTVLGEMGDVTIGKDGKAVSKEEAFVKELVQETQPKKQTNSNFI